MYHSQAAITINGSPASVLPGVTIATLLRAHEIAPEMVIVELNGHPLTPGEIKATPVQEGDVLEVVQVVAGG